MPTANMVLLVEDEPLVRTFATLFLEEELGCPYEVAGSRDEALRLLQDHAEKVAVVFTDMRMATDDDGAELARIVSRRWPWIGLLVTSGGERPHPAALPGKARFVTKTLESGRGETVYCFTPEHEPGCRAGRTRCTTHCPNGLTSLRIPRLPV